MKCCASFSKLMHHKHKCQFSLGRWTVATVNASNVGTLKTGLQHTRHIAPTGLLRTHKPNIAYIQYVGDRSTQKTKPRRGDAGSGNAGAVSHDHQGQGAVAHHLKPTSSFARQQTREDTHTEQTVPYPPHPHSPPHSVCCPHTVSVAVPIEM